MRSSVILAGCRTPLGKFQGALAGHSAPQLAAATIRHLMVQGKVAPEHVDEVVLGHVLSAGTGQAPARQAAFHAGLPLGISAFSVNMVCGSGLKAVMLADQSIRSDDTQCVIAGGMENMSRAPHLFLQGREGVRLGAVRMEDAVLYDGLRCSIQSQAMSELAEELARKLSISRQDQDAFAAESHRRAAMATAAGHFRAEIVPIEIKAGRDRMQLEFDEGVRANASTESLAQVEPTHGPKGTITAGNSAPHSDGAAAVLIASEKFAQRKGTPIAARIVATAATGVAPHELFTAPVAAIKRVLDSAGWSVDQVDLWEMGESFAVQSLACLRGLGIDVGRLNIHGGMIALGNPLGASACRGLVTLLHAMATHRAKRGVIAVSIGGGNALAMAIERPEE